MKKYLLVSPKPPPLHGETYAVDLLLKGFPRADVEIVHLDARFVEELVELQKASFKKVFRLLKYLLKMVVLRFQHKFDGVILTPSFYGVPFIKDSTFVWLAKLLRFPKVLAWFHMDFRTHTLAKPGRLRSAYFRLTVRRCDHYVCVSPRLIENLPPYMPRERAVALLNGVPPFPGDAPEPRDDDYFRAVYFSYMSPAKGWKVFLKAARIACSRNPKLEVLFYGRPTTESPEVHIKEVFGHDDSGGRIRFVGALRDGEKEAPLRAADVFCFPSLNEAFPLTVLEAMAAGLPIIASDVGGVPDALVEGKGGKLLEPGSAEVIADALCEFALMDKSQLKEMGAFNASRFSEMFTDEAYCDRWEKLLSTLGSEPVDTEADA